MLLHYDRNHMDELGRPLLDAGILPTLIELNRLGNRMAAGEVLRLSAAVLLAAPSSELGQLGAGHCYWRNLLMPLLSMSKHVASEISQSALAM
jgi:hypothetical protein